MYHSKLILTALLFGQCVLADAQSPLQDAIKLKSMLADLPALRQTRSEAELQFKDIERQVKNDKESLRRIESNGQKPTAAQRLEWGLHVQLFDSLQVLAQRAVLADTVAKNAVARIVQLYLEERGEETLKRAEIAGLIEEHHPFLKGVGITVENISTGLDGSITGRLNSAGANARLGQGEFLVAEADESDASFLFLSPVVSEVTNIDADHMETYGHDFARLKKAFVDFLNRLPFYGVAVLCLDDPDVPEILPRVTKQVVTYGLDKEANIRAEHVVADAGCMRFTCVRTNGKTTRFDVTLNLPGMHNVLNALAAIAVATEVSVGDTAIVKALAEFTRLQST